MALNENQLSEPESDELPKGFKKMEIVFKPFPS